MKRVHEEDDDINKEPNKERRIALYERKQEIGFFRSLWPCEQSRFLLALKGLLSTGIVFDIIIHILTDFLHLSTYSKIRCRGKDTPFEQNVRVYAKDEDPVLFNRMMQEYKRKQRQSIIDSRNALIERGVSSHYIHVLSANVPTDGLGGVYPYDETIFDDMNLIYIPFNVMYMCVDIRDKAAILQYLAEVTVEELQSMEDTAISTHNNMVNGNKWSFWFNVKSILFDDVEILRY